LAIHDALTGLLRAAKEKSPGQASADRGSHNHKASGITRKGG
jgi:hypothetical protein